MTWWKWFISVTIFFKYVLAHKNSTTPSLKRSTFVNIYIFYKHSIYIFYKYPVPLSPYPPHRRSTPKEPQLFIPYNKNSLTIPKHKPQTNHNWKFSSSPQLYIDVYIPDICTLLQSDTFLLIWFITSSDWRAVMLLPWRYRDKSFKQKYLLTVI